jgi:hypothetical protein
LILAGKIAKMSNTRISMTYITQILNLYKTGSSRRTISKILGIHRSTVSYYIDCYVSNGSPVLDDTDSSGILCKLCNAKPVKPINDRYLALEEFVQSRDSRRKMVGFTIENLYGEYIELYQDQTPYSRAQFYKIVNSLWNTPKGSVKLNHRLGDKLYIDYTGKLLKYYDTTLKREVSLQVMVCILPASGYIYVEAMESQRIGMFLQGIISALNYIGGVPKALVTDNLKSAVTRVGKYESIINQQLQNLTSYYGTTCDPTRSRAPTDKAMVEGAVKIVYSKIFYHTQNKQYGDIKEVNQAIRSKLLELNLATLSNSDKSRLDQFAEEQAYLSPLPVYPYELMQCQRAKVQKMGYVLCSQYKNYYSVPYIYIGKQVELHYNTRTLEIIHANQRIAVHDVNLRKGHYTTNTNHLSSQNKVVAEWSPEYFKDKAKHLGTKANEYISRLIDSKPYPEQSYKQILGILNLAKQYGGQRLDAACYRALQIHQYRYGLIKQILENNMDQVECISQDEQNHTIIPHENVRGASYYY